MDANNQGFGGSMQGFAGSAQSFAGSNQVASEIRAVDEIVHALKVTMSETACQPSLDSLNCVKHGAEFLEDHLRRLFRLEEDHGLLEILLYIHPEFAHEVVRLQQEHEVIRSEAHRLVLQLENACRPSDAELHDILEHLRLLIIKIVNHEHHETAVLVESVNRDEGGEG
ncbi:hypothetical protein [Anatilimnocola floriformis]|uniref:hypothetical protein n=1 Tax=Anatilimnocola floriformis TaxID=2948575 RepID=UPI0020C31F77|nr:hypothetical protein [Anatilimnocola floriformis]